MSHGCKDPGSNEESKNFGESRSFSLYVLRACNKTLPEIRSDHLSVLLVCRFTKWAPDSTGMNPLNFPEADFWPGIGFR